MSKYVRVMARKLNNNKQEESPLYFDVIIDLDNEIQGEHAIFAFHGDLGNRNGSSMPFVLYSHDRADFGEFAPPENRHEEITLRGKKITKGQRFVYRGNGFYDEFEIVEIKSMLETD